MQLSKNKLMEKIIELWRLFRWARAIKKKEKRERPRAEMMTEEERITLFRISSATNYPTVF